MPIHHTLLALCAACALSCLSPSLSAQSTEAEREPANPLLDDAPAKPKPDPDDPLADLADQGDPLADLADPFAGVFRNDVLTVELTFEAAKARFTGALKRGGRSFPITAKREGESLTGQYSAGGKGFPFKATLEGDTLRFAASSNIFSLKRDRAIEPATPGATSGAPRTTQPRPADSPANPLLPATPRPAAAAAARDAGPMMKTMRHPNGLTYKFPQRWRLSSTPQNVYLFPDLTKKGVDGTPLEVCLISVRSSPLQVADAQDPKLLEFFDELMKVNAPFLKRTDRRGTIESIMGAGTVVGYQGKSPDGSESVADVYGVFDGEHCFYLVHIGRSDLVEANRPLVAHVVSTFGWRESESDSALAGVWARTDAAETLQFKPNGECSSETQPKAAGGTTAVAAPPVIRRGVWSVTDKKLYIAWSDGAADVFGFEMVAEAGKTTTLVLMKTGGQPIRFTK